jgi:hypothetical protein
MKPATREKSLQIIRSLPAATLAHFGLCLLGLWLASPVAGEAATIWNGPAITFTHTDENGLADQLTPGVAFDRSSAGLGLYNSVTESSATAGTSPEDTEWAVGNLTNYNALTYGPCPLEQGMNPPRFIGTTFVVHLINENIFLSLTLTDWGGQGEQGDRIVAYTRTTPAVVIPPVLTVKANPGGAATQPPNSIILTWPTNSSGFTLESATTLLPLTIWTPVANPPVVINGQYTVTNISSGAQQFFQLANFGVSPQFNQAGNVLIADQWNNRVIETTPSGAIIWSYGLGPLDFSANSPISVNDAERVGNYTLMANPGDAPGVIPQTPDGSADNRVLLVDPTGKIVWQYGQFGQAGDGPNLLNTPVQCTFVPDFNVLITDQGNNRVIEVNYNREIVWQYPGGDTNAADQLVAPNSAELLANGNILIADQGNSRALEVTGTGQIVNTFSAGGTVNILAFASRLPNGNTLLTDAGNARIVEVDANDLVVWQYFTTNAASTDGAGDLSVAAPQPTRALRLANGDTLISDQLNNRVIRVNPSGTIVADYGLPLPAGGGTFSGGSAGILIGNNVGYDLNTTQGGLYSPYDAKIIGDYTGITPPAK